MILVSIHPFHFKKGFLLVVGLICLCSVFCLADSIYLTASVAPSQQPTPQSQNAQVAVPVNDFSFGVINGWMADSQQIPYAINFEPNPSFDGRIFVSDPFAVSTFIAQH